MAQSAVECVTGAYERKYNIDGAQKELVRAPIPRIIKELATTGGAMESGRTACACGAKVGATIATGLAECP
jgi:hypothetical protein